MIVTCVERKLPAIVAIRIRNPEVNCADGKQSEFSIKVLNEEKENGNALSRRDRFNFPAHS